MSADAHIDLSIEEILDLAPKSGPHSAPKMEVEKVKAHCAPSLFPPPFGIRKRRLFLGRHFLIKAHIANQVIRSVLDHLSDALISAHAQINVCMCA